MLLEAQAGYSEGAYSDAYKKYEMLTSYVCSAKVAQTLEADKLSALKEDVRRGVSGFAFCQEEALYEKSCELMDYLRM